MLVQILTGFLISMVCVMIHAMATIAAIGVARAVGVRQTRWPRAHLMAVMVATVVVLKAAHGLEVVVWALAYALVGAAPEGSDLLYFAFVNYTTLGYGDVTPVKAWQLLGPMAAMNGILMFGWSTAVLFEVLMKELAHLATIAPPGSPFSAVDRG
ncbi:MAG: two pore domain potassium channel family protein [Bradyrhizobium sp.]|nr:two pore domain potassium channel family protein [Bradyrhizobium sp.]